MKNGAFEDGFVEGMKTMHTPLPETVILEIWIRHNVFVLPRVQQSNLNLWKLLRGVQNRGGLNEIWSSSDH